MYARTAAKYFPRRLERGAKNFRDGRVRRKEILHNARMSLPVLYLKPNEQRRLRAGHLWIFSNEVDIARSPLTAFAPGDAVQIAAHGGHVLGTGYVNPHSLICARLVSRDPDYVLNESLLVHRLNVALSLRERLYARPYYRLVFGEADGLPGVVIDRFDDVYVAQISTAGMERVKDVLLAALVKVMKPRAVLWRNDSGSRELEGLPRYVVPALGEVPALADVQEYEAQFSAPVQAGQKTGWFYDHYANRGRLRAYVRGRRVLDVFSYVGAWGIQAALAGATSVTCIDSSTGARDWTLANAARNRVAVDFIVADAFDALRDLRAGRERFDVVVVDPPAFIKRKKDAREGVQAYRRINEMAMQVLAKDGMLVSSSCSYHLPREVLMQQLLQASRHLDRNMQAVETGAQAPDHPIHPAIPETEYLKCVFARILPA